MKKAVLSLIAIVLITTNTFAANIKEKFSVQVKVNSTENNDNQELKNNVSLAFNSIQSLNEYNFNELNISAAQCSVTVTVSVVVVSVSTTTTCDRSDVDATIKKLAKIAVQQLEQI